MKRTFLFIAMAIAASAAFAQKKTTTSGVVKFDAATSLDPLPKAENKTVVAAIDPAKGTLAFEVPVKNFSFSNPKMQEHFNGPSWLDSEKFPTSTFKGKITNASAINFTKDGSYDAEVAGDLTMHGVSQPVKTTGKIVVSGQSIAINADFSVKLSDYSIDSPPVGAGKVSREPKISVSAELN